MQPSSASFAVALCLLVSMSQVHCNPKGKGKMSSKGIKDLAGMVSCGSSKMPGWCAEKSSCPTGFSIDDDTCPGADAVCCVSTHCWQAGGMCLEERCKDEKSLIVEYKTPDNLVVPITKEDCKPDLGGKPGYCCVAMR